MTSGYPLPPLDSPDERRHRRDIARAVRGAMQGQTENVLLVTLTANQATTTVTDDRIRFCAGLFFTPLTANAAAALATTYVSETGRVNGSVTINHANNAQTDRDFRVALIG